MTNLKYIKKNVSYDTLQSTTLFGILLSTILDKTLNNSQQHQVITVKLLPQLRYHCSLVTTASEY